MASHICELISFILITLVITWITFEDINNTNNIGAKIRRRIVECKILPKWHWLKSFFGMRYTLTRMLLLIGLGLGIYGMVASW